MVDVSHYLIGSGQRDSSLKQRVVPGQPSCFSVLWLLYRDMSGSGNYSSSLAKQQEKKKAWFWRLGEGVRLMAYINAASTPSCSRSRCLQQCLGPCVESGCENGAEPGGQKKWQEAELFPGNVQISGSNHACSPQQIWKTYFLGQFEKNPKLLIIQSILVYTILHWVFCFFSSIFKQLEKSPHSECFK